MLKESKSPPCLITRRWDSNEEILSPISEQRNDFDLELIQNFQFLAEIVTQLLTQNKVMTLRLVLTIESIPVNTCQKYEYRKMKLTPLSFRMQKGDRNIKSVIKQSYTDGSNISSR